MSFVEILDQIIDYLPMNFLLLEKPELLNDFDLIFSGFVLYHMANLDELERFLKNVFDLLKIGGKTIHILPFMFNEETVNDGRVDKVELMDKVIVYDIYWSKETIIQLMKQIGFRNIKIQLIQVSEEGKLKMGIECSTKMDSLGYKILTAEK